MTTFAHENEALKNEDLAYTFVNSPRMQKSLMDQCKILKSSARLEKCIANFQKISDAKGNYFRVDEILIAFLKQGHTKKNALLLTKMTIRGQISPFAVEAYRPKIFLLSKVADTMEEKGIFLEKRVLNAPHYRDIEYKHKKKRF